MPNKGWASRSLNGARRWRSAASGYRALQGQAFQDALADYGMLCSMSRKDNGWDNAPTESGFNSVKNERIFGDRFCTRDVMKATAFEHIEAFHNRKRLHATLGYTSPVH